MAEIQKSSNTGEMAARFIEFVMMQAQNASLFLGLTPNPSTGRAETNLDLARMFIDQLAMIQDKTRGNLSEEESKILRNVLGNLQMAFVEASAKGAPGGRIAPGSAPAPTAVEEGDEDETCVPDAAAPVSPTGPTAPSTPAAASAAEVEERESKKRFTKSYGS